MEEEKLPYKKKNNGVGLLLTFAFLSFMLFLAGFTVRDVFFSDNKSTNDDNKEEKKEVKDSIPYTDKEVFSTYGGIYTLYIIDDEGDLYYKSSNEYFAGLNLCPSAVDYCNANENYNNELEKVSGISKVKRIKYVLDIAASDERFKLFAIDETGDVYTVESKTAKKVIEGQKITNMNGFSVTNHYYSFATNDKEKRIDYTWVVDAKGGHYDIKTVTA